MTLDDKFDGIKKLIDVGKEKGYLTYDEVNERDVLPSVAAQQKVVPSADDDLPF